MRYILFYNMLNGFLVAELYAVFDDNLQCKFVRALAGILCEMKNLRNTTIGVAGTAQGSHLSSFSWTYKPLVFRQNSQKLLFSTYKNFPQFCEIVTFRKITIGALQCDINCLVKSFLQESSTEPLQNRVSGRMTEVVADCKLMDLFFLYLGRVKNIFLMGIPFPTSGVLQIVDDPKERVEMKQKQP